MVNYFFLSLQLNSILEFYVSSLVLAQIRALQLSTQPLSYRSDTSFVLKDFDYIHEMRICKHLNCSNLLSDIQYGVFKDRQSNDLFPPFSLTFSSPFRRVLFCGTDTIEFPNFTLSKYFLFLCNIIFLIPLYPLYSNSCGLPTFILHKSPTSFLLFIKNFPVVILFSIYSFDLKKTSPQQ